MVAVIVLVDVVGVVVVVVVVVILLIIIILVEVVVVVIVVVVVVIVRARDCLAAHGYASTVMQVTTAIYPSTPQGRPRWSCAPPAVPGGLRPEPHRL